jgi:hypothetical protein
MLTATVTNQGSLILRKQGNRRVSRCSAPNLQWEAKLDLPLAPRDVVKEQVSIHWQNLSKGYTSIQEGGRGLEKECLPALLWGSRFPCETPAPDAALGEDDMKSRRLRAYPTRTTVQYGAGAGVSPCDRAT